MVFFAFLGFFALVLIISGAILNSKLNRFLSEPSAIKGINLFPSGFERKGLLHFYWDSLGVQGAEWQTALQEFDVRLALLPRPALSVESKQTRVKLSQPASSDSAKKPLTALEFPNIRIPFPVTVRSEALSVTVDSVGSWALDSLRLESEGTEAIHLEFQNLQGKYLTDPLDFNSKLAWNEHFVDANLNLGAGTDSLLHLKAHAPRTALHNLSGELSLQVDHPDSLVFSHFLDADVIAEIPQIENFKTKSSFSVNLLKQDFNYKASVEFDMREFWPLPALHGRIESFGNPKASMNTDIRLDGKKGEKIALKGYLKLNGDGDFTGKTENISALFGPEKMPMNATIHSAVIKNGDLNVRVETAHGSMVSGTIFDLYSSPHIQFTGDISSKEPWAVQWSGDNLILGGRPQIRGSWNYRDGMEATVKITPVQYAYLMSADYLETHLNLDLSGISFDRGRIRRRQDEFTFTGRVLWDETRRDSVPHTAWQLHHGDSGTASVWVSFDPELRLSAKDISTKSIPFADSTLMPDIQALVSADWDHHFNTNIGNLQASFEANVKDFALQGNILARENGDSVILESANVIHQNNEIDFEAGILLREDPKSELPVTLLYAKTKTEKFDITALLNTFGISILNRGYLSGNFAYNHQEGVEGVIDFEDVTFHNIDSAFFAISNLKLVAAGEKIEITSALSLGDGGAWSGNAQILVNDLLKNSRVITASHSTNQGGTLWVEGVLDSKFNWNGSLFTSGFWFLPSGMGAIRNTDFKADIQADFRKGLAGIRAAFRSDSTVYQAPVAILGSFPIRIAGDLKNGVLDLPDINAFNEKNESIKASLRFDLNNMELKSIAFNSERYTFDFGNGVHRVLLENASGKIHDSEREIVVTGEFPSIRYQMAHPSYGDAEVKIHGEVLYHIPHSQKGSFSNSSIEGNVFIDKAVYRKQINIDFGMKSLNSLLNTLSNFFVKLRMDKPQPIETTALVQNRPASLSIHIQESQQDSLAVVSNVATFPFTVDVWVLGSTAQPSLRGDINNAGDGFVGFGNFFHFDLQSLAISWQDVPWKRGSVDLVSSENLPYCDVSKNSTTGETCPVFLNIRGSLTNPQPEPYSNCAARQSPASVYYSILLGCISEEDENNNIDGDKVAGKIIGTFLAATANKTLGGDYVGDIDMKLNFFNDNNGLEKDSSYLKIPISLDRWVKNLSLIFGFTEDQSIDPVYDQAYELGLSYKLPVFEDADTTEMDHLNPALNFRGNLISRTFHGTLESSEEGSRIEKNVGFDYTYQFWTPSFLGFKRSTPPKKTSEHEKQ
ncbi:MAG: hypothetical protein LBR60_06225 [Fibrobacter sp.]|jgi:hypothetical protein|nr:hypothetical protein [Fibrobacter sp.]